MDTHVRSDELFTREEVLQGLHGRRASKLLHQIEAATARAIKSRQQIAAVTGGFIERSLKHGEKLLEESISDQEKWFGSFKEPEGDNLLSLQQIERYSQAWGYLVPESPPLQAAVARLLGRKYRIQYDSVPFTRLALDLDSEKVKQAYQDLYNETLDHIYEQQIGFAERLRWQWSQLGKRLDTLPPFWIAFSYSLMGNFTEAVVILPIVTAAVGTIAGLYLLIGLGFANLLTIHAMAEALVRSGSIEYRNSFLGRMTFSFLGPVGSRLAYFNSIAQWFLVVLAGHVGLSQTLSHVVGLPTAFWVVLWAAVLIYRLWRIEHSFSISNDILLGIATVGMIIMLSIIALANRQPNFWASLATPHEGNAIDLTMLAAALGGILFIFYGHNAIPLSAKLVLPRDPSGRSFISGSMAGLLVAVTIEAFWLISIHAALPASALLHHAHTALEPLGEHLGTGVTIAGVLTLILFIAMDGMGASDALFNLIREQIPVVSHFLGSLAKNQGRLIFYRRNLLDSIRPRVGITYLGLNHDHPKFRIDVQVDYTVKRFDITVADHWELSTLFDQIPELKRQNYHLLLEVLNTDDEHSRFLITTALGVSHEKSKIQTGFNLIESLNMRSRERNLLYWLMTQGEGTIADAVEAGLGTEEEVSAQFSLLEQQHMAKRIDNGSAENNWYYQLQWTKRRHSRLPSSILQNLETMYKPPMPAAPPEKQPTWLQKHRLALSEHINDGVHSELGGFILGVLPVVAAALLTLVLLAIGKASFIGILGAGGVLTLILASGILPMLLLRSSRSKGQHSPSGHWNLLGSPWVVVAIYIVFMGLLLMHGLVIWEGVIARASALIVAGIVLLSTLLIIRHGAFRRRLAIEIKDDLRPGRHSHLRIMLGGQPLEFPIEFTSQADHEVVETTTNVLPDFSSLKRIKLTLPAIDASELKVWAHRVTPEGDSEPLPIRMLIELNGEQRQFDLGLSGGQILLPLKDVTPLQINLEETEVELL